MTVEISTDPARLDIALIHSFLSEESPWSQGISRERVVRALEHSLCFCAHDGARQVGLARVVTDRAPTLGSPTCSCWRVIAGAASA